MLKLFSGLLGGAGSIAGLLPFVPWILAAVLALGGGGIYLWKQHDVDAANAAVASITVERNAALVKVGTLQSALNVDDETISQQMANINANDVLIDQFNHQAAEDARISADAGKQIRTLQDADASVAAYLAAPIPCGLRAILNGSPGPAASAGSADKDDCAAPAQAIGMPAAGAHVQGKR